ncbi:hypothetical protein D3C73_1369480 [compost metagenome]
MGPVHAVLGAGADRLGAGCTDRRSGWRALCPEQDRAEYCDSGARFYADHACVCVPAAGGILFLAGCRSRSHCFYYICDSANDPAHESGDSPGIA